MARGQPKTRTTRRADRRPDRSSRATSSSTASGPVSIASPGPSWAMTGPNTITTSRSNEQGRRLAWPRLPEGLDGVTRLHALIASVLPAEGPSAGPVRRPAGSRLVSRPSAARGLPRWFLQQSDNGGMPTRWTIGRVVNRVHRDVLLPLGFTRQGNVCTRSDSLHREIQFYTPRWGDPEAKGVQVFLLVKISGLPEPLVEFRRDALWTHLEPVRGLAAYPRPASPDPPPRELMEDVAGPGVDFLCHAKDLRDFIAWAEDVHAGGGAWGPFQHVYPKGAAPLLAAALAAALLGDHELAQRTADAVETQERGKRELRDFKIERDRLPGV